MSNSYRFYCLDGVGHLQSAEWFEAEDDDAAIALIEAGHPDAPFEIWLGSRMVANPLPRRRSA